MDLTRNPVLNELVPKEFYLVQNYPNPFKDKTTIKYCVAYKTNVKLTVYDSEGEVIKILVDEEKKPGTYEMEFYAANLPVGVYFYKLVAGKFIDTKKMAVQK
ncbi:MAG: T9SS type A sorting domain-containing protein [Ignavibacteriaceae bacterium]|jgi:hypothetical protein|nr:T9SS type A sorting domain-containing protein [Ignavibacteriaceae bacterium]